MTVHDIAYEALEQVNKKSTHLMLVVGPKLIWALQYGELSRNIQYVSHISRLFMVHGCQSYYMASP